MKPAPFTYVRPASVADASRLLLNANDRAKAVAGGQSLGPMMNLRIAQPETLIDITGIPEMSQVGEDSGAVMIGAAVTTSAIEDGRVPTHALSMLPAIAGGIAYRAVRNRGTVGGSICHADPAADWITSLTALMSECIVSGPAGVRRIPLQDFVVSAFETALEPGELLTAIRIPRVSRTARWGYEKIARKTGEFALALAAVLIDPDRGLYRAVVGATAGRPIVIADAREMFGSGSTPSVGDWNEAAALRCFEQNGLDRRRSRHHLVALQRALARAVSA
jgi:aerobic carbon-monoxide dehydrogenase medium subunit